MELLKARFEVKLRHICNGPSKNNEENTTIPFPTCVVSAAIGLCAPTIYPKCGPDAVREGSGLPVSSADSAKFTPFREAV